MTASDYSATARPSASSRPQHLRLRLLTAFVLTVLLLGLATGGGSALVAYRSGLTHIREHLGAIATLKEAEISAWTEALQGDLRVELARDAASQRIEALLRQPPDSSAYRKAYVAQKHRFSETIALRPTFHELFLMNAQGSVVLSSDPSIEGNVWDWLPYFRAGLESPGVHVQTLSYSGVTADLNTVVVVHPIRDETGAAIGVLVGRASLDPLNDIMLERTGLGRSGETYLVGSNKVLLTQSRFPGYKAGQIRADTRAVRTALRHREPGFMLQTDYRGVPVVAVYRWLPQLQVVLMAELDQREAFAPTATTIYLNLVLTGLGMLIVGVAALLITRDIVNPIVTLSRTARDIAAGDLLLRAPVRRDDEIGELAAAFNHMTGRLRAMLRREADRSTELEREIAHRKLAEREREQLLARVQEQARQVREIIATVPEGVLLLDGEGRVVQANPLGQKDIAALAGAEVGDRLDHLGDVPLTDLLTSPPKGLWHSVESSGRSFQMLARPIKLSSVDLAPADLAPDDMEAPSAGWVLVIRDVTQQREIEQRVRQQERLAAVGQLAAGIAHDFNNIMATIVLYAQMMVRSSHIPARDRERISLITQQARHAADLIQQILDFSRRAVLEMQPLNILPLLKEQVKFLERTLPENIRISLTYGEDDEYVIRGDPTRIQQMIMNLAVNARDAMPEGGELRIALERFTLGPQASPPLPEMGPGPWLWLSVADTGVGIPDEVMTHIFEPFFTTKEPGQGTGLGLAQVHGIVGAHAGFIKVESEVGYGTTFTVYLSALPEPNVVPANSTSTGRGEALPMGRGEMLLVVEDNAVTCEAVVEALRELNYQAVTAVDGREALAVLARHRDTPTEPAIDLVLSDVVMPGMGGEALLHALHAQGYDVPVVLMSGHPLQNMRDGLEQSDGAALLAGWLSKPPTLERLARTIAGALDA
jgi:signal transduction histidine kinase